MAATTAAVIGAGATIWGEYQDSQSAGDALDAQQDQNAQNLAFVKEQAAQARQDIIPLYDQSRQSLIDSSQAAADVIGNTANRQLNQARTGNLMAQATLLQGMPQFENAIMGRPVNRDALQVKNTNSGNNAQWLFNPQIPDSGGSYAELLTGGNPEFQEYANSGVTNSQLVDRAYKLGVIAEPDYAWFQNLFAETSDNFSGPDATAWGNLNADNLPSNIFQGVTGENKARIMNLINAT